MTNNISQRLEKLEKATKAMKQGFISMRKEMVTKKELKDLEARLEQKIDKKLDEFRHEMTKVVFESVDILKVLIEALRSDIGLLAEGREPLIGKLDTHHKTIANHETRITTLEDYARIRK